MRPTYIIAALLCISCSEKNEPEDTAQTCTEVTEDFTMTSEEYDTYLSEAGELTEESCNTICEATETEYHAIVECSRTGQATGDPDNPATSIVTCTYHKEPC